MALPMCMPRGAVKLVPAIYVTLLLMMLCVAWTEPDAAIRLETCAVAVLFAWSAYATCR
jgi:hypothetical protein